MNHGEELSGLSNIVWKVMILQLNGHRSVPKLDIQIQMFLQGTRVGVQALRHVNILKSATPRAVQVVLTKEKLNHLSCSGASSQSPKKKL